MFTPVTGTGRLFKQYLTGFAHPSKIRIQNIFGQRFFSEGIQVRNADGTLFLLDANDWITRVILKEGDYEHGSTKLAKDIMKDGGLFLDIGANFGLFSCLVAHSNPKASVIAIEPNHKIIERLLGNIRMNGLQDRVKILNAAVGNGFGFVTLEQPAAGNIGTTRTNTNGKGELSILSCSLAFICEQNDNQPVELMKIDIEGNEFSILEKFPFETCLIKNIILEFNHLSKVSFATLISFFESKGFKSFTIHGEPLTEELPDIPENNIWFVNQK